MNDEETDALAKVLGEQALVVGTASAGVAILIASIKREYGTNINAWPLHMKVAAEGALSLTERIAGPEVRARLDTLVTLFEKHLEDVPVDDDEAYAWTEDLVKNVGKIFEGIKFDVPKAKKGLWL